MDVYADLKVYGDQRALLDAASDIERSLGSGWSRSQDLEKRIRSSGPVRCFTCTATASRRAANLWFSESADRSHWAVNNIVPTSAERLSEAQYNAILEEFRTSFVEPVIRNRGLRVEMSRTSEDLEDWLNPDAAQALRDFSEAANKSTGAGHPLDKERWFRFLIAVHNDEKGPSPSDLRQWLIEEEEWPADVAADLAIEYENALALLKQFDDSE